MTQEHGKAFKDYYRMLHWQALAAFISFISFFLFMHQSSEP